jgi:hypothetical protein
VRTDETCKVFQVWTHSKILWLGIPFFLFKGLLTIDYSAYLHLYIYLFVHLLLFKRHIFVHASFDRDYSIKILIKITNV